MEYKIVYNSDVIISNPIEFSTFSIFYDKIILPYADRDGRVLKIIKHKGKYGIPSNANWIKDANVHNDNRPQFDESIAEWDANSRVLFEEGVFERLEKSKPNADDDSHLKELSVAFLRSPSTRVAVNDKKEIFIPATLVDHLRRKDVEHPGVFTIRKGESKREVFKVAQAMHTFRYLIPALNKLHPEEILEIRSKVKDLREGFSMHLQKLSAKVETGLQENASWKDISNSARKVIETELIPDYWEFRRLLNGRKVGFWARVLQTAGRVLEIDAAPWTPLFWGKLTSTMGATVSNQMKEGKERLSNSNLAYKFMHVCEG